MSALSLSGDEIRRLFGLLERRLETRCVIGELHLVGGAVMCLVFQAREATRDVDALFEPKAIVREAAADVAAQEHLPASWLNDAVKAFLGTRAAFDPVPFLDLPHLRVFVAEPHYLLALKCAAMRLGPEFHDEDDVRYLLRHLDVRSVEQALEIVTRYVEPDRIPAKTRFALEELLPRDTL